MKQISGWSIMTLTTVSGWDAWESESCLRLRRRCCITAANHGGRLFSGRMSTLISCNDTQESEIRSTTKALAANGMPVAINPRHFVHTERIGKLKVLMISHNLNLEGAPKVLFDHAAYFASSGRYNVTMVSLEDGPLRGQVEETGIPVRIVEGVLPRSGENTSRLQRTIARNWHEPRGEIL